MKPALISIRIFSVINLALAALFISLSFFNENTVALMVMGTLSGLFGYFYLQIHRGLREKKYWAWVAGIIVSGMYSVSLLFPLGIMGLVGLLNQGTRREFSRQDLKAA